MRRWLFLSLTVVLVSASTLLALHFYRPPVQSVPHSGLTRVPLSAYKYQLCTEAFAFAYAGKDNPYKTDYTFKDPFRSGKDTLIPHLLGHDAKTGTVSFMVDVIVNKVATFHEKIDHIQELDGIAVTLPDTQNRANHTAVPQFIISHFGSGKIAVLDYTCPDQWVWKPKT